MPAPPVDEAQLKMWKRLRNPTKRSATKKCYSVNLSLSNHSLIQPRHRTSSSTSSTFKSPQTHSLPSRHKSIALGHVFVAAHGPHQPSNSRQGEAQTAPKTPETSPRLHPESLTATKLLNRGPSPPRFIFRLHHNQLKARPTTNSTPRLFNLISYDRIHHRQTIQVLIPLRTYDLGSIATAAPSLCRTKATMVNKVEGLSILSRGEWPPPI